MSNSSLQKVIDYYNDQQKGLGKRFAKEVFKSSKQLEKNPYFQIRYDDIRCLPIHKFPFMIHYSINEDLGRVLIFAILHTSINPEENWMSN